ncbi:hypothetical protein [Hoeflea sp.]|uniref:sunset domain-containing protein n=1 Tax=Hoeflea sp. TaxID=1940281 RepID=UPI0019A16CB5|nr:hypothetical protein [Hoeflea sp.]MBC7281131.1 hypothetical protein [Hoeflea sp.]
MARFAAVVMLCSAAAFAAPTAFQAAASRVEAFRNAEPCVIKGNISINSGERIYHVPGQEDYEATRIRSEYGERWFCTEAEARAAGWRKAGR